MLIEVVDNGAGINRERVLQIAIDKGLIPPDAQLSNSEIDNLLFLPGFSTAQTVSDLSGRGVGMDVVKRSIAALGGRISITSQPGEGSTFSISLPLTLAILDGMIVSVADQTVVVPLSAILEMLKPEEAQIHPLGADERVVQVRGEFVPIIDVGHQLGFGEALTDFQDRVILLIETSDGDQRALVVDGYPGPAAGGDQGSRGKLRRGLRDRGRHDSGRRPYCPDPRYRCHRLRRGAQLLRKPHLLRPCRIAP